MAEKESEKDKTIKLDKEGFAMTLQGLLRQKLIGQKFKTPPSLNHDPLSAFGPRLYPMAEPRDLEICYVITDLGMEFYRARQALPPVTETDK